MSHVLPFDSIYVIVLLGIAGAKSSDTLDHYKDPKEEVWMAHSWGPCDCGDNPHTSPAMPCSPTLVRSRPSPGMPRLPATLRGVFSYAGAC
jgi:hypothetical protein